MKKHKVYLYFEFVIRCCKDSIDFLSHKLVIPDTVCNDEECCCVLLSVY